MKHYFTLLIATFCLTSGIMAGNDDVLFRIDGDPVSVEEFEYIYNKNNFNNKADYSEKSLREYLELYINFRLKVKEAESLGLDEDAKLQSELKVYQEQLYNSFFDREKLKALVDEAIERSAHDVLISHIFIGASSEADEATTKPKRDEIEKAYAALEKGQSFEEVARTFSEDRYTKDDGGKLAYYTALQIAYYPLENAAFETAVGEYSKPVRTALGYHIVKVNDKRPARGMAKAAVIKLNKKKGDSEQTVMASIETLYSELKAGADFGEYAIKYSQDAATKAKGGEMDWFGIARYDQRFEDAVFNLENIGDISAPFETGEAWYIVKLLDTKGPSSADEDREIITKKVKQSDRYQITYDNHINGILDKYGFEVEQIALDKFKAVYSLEPNNLPTYLETMKSDPVIARIAGNEFKESDFGKYIQENGFRYRRLDADVRFNTLFEDFKTDKAVEFHIIEYGNENREYGALLNEYRDGILLFELMETNVWSRAVEDTSGLRDYFYNNRDQFTNPESASVKVYKAESSKKASMLAKVLKSDPGLTSVSQLNKLNKKGISTNYEDLKVLKTDALADKLPWSKGTRIIEEGGTFAVYQVTDIQAETPRSFDNSKGFAIAEYQEFLEAEWITNLREKYNVVVDEEVLKGLVK